MSMIEKVLLQKLAREIMTKGYDEPTAWKFTRLIGDTPIVDETGAIVILDGNNSELARFLLESFSD